MSTTNLPDKALVFRKGVKGVAAGLGGGSGDLSEYAKLESPQFTGEPKTSTPSTSNISTRIANTRFVDRAISAKAALKIDAALEGKPTTTTPPAGSTGKQIANAELDRTIKDYLAKHKSEYGREKDAGSQRIHWNTSYQ